MALAMCIIMGSIDLSVAGLLATSGIVMFALLVHMGINLAVSILAALIFGIFFGFFNGIIFAYTDLPPFLITLATTNIIRGIGFVYTNGKTIVANNEMVWWIGKKYLFGFLPVSLLITVICGIFVWFFLNKLRTGTYVYAIGGNLEATQNAGINVKKVKIIVHTISGFLAAIAGILLACRMESATARAGVAYEADAISASVLGGVSFTGGRGTLGGVMIGALIIAAISNGMNAMGLSDNLQFVVKGLVVIIVVFLDTAITNMRKRAVRDSNR
jgi:ribose transport system permease protein